jgi:hypothetical protein
MTSAIGAVPILFTTVVSTWHCSKDFRASTLAFRAAKCSDVTSASVLMLTSAQQSIIILAFESTIASCSELQPHPPHQKLTSTPPSSRTPTTDEVRSGVKVPVPSWCNPVDVASFEPTQKSCLDLMLSCRPRGPSKTDSMHDKHFSAFGE